MQDNPLEQLKSLGQSIWYDNIDRSQLDSGFFARLMLENGVTGVTANPTIFEKSVRIDDTYDEQISLLKAVHEKPEEIYDALIVDDIREAADLLMPIYEKTDGADGFVSLEVSPQFAHNAAQTTREAQRYWQLVNRPNLMIKIPATPEGVQAIFESLALGINVNVTLIFSLASYRAIADAYIRALEARVAKGEDIHRLACVASFFVSRVDTLVDQLLKDKLEQLQDASSRAQIESLFGKAAIANARLAYQEFENTFQSKRFEQLALKGGRPQKPLWASTSTKNPAYRDVMYVEELIGPHTINTMPLETIERFKDHGRAQITIGDKLAQAPIVFEQLGSFGIRYDEVTNQLLEEGLQKFSASYQSLLSSLQERHRLIKAQGNR